MKVKVVKDFSRDSGLLGDGKSKLKLLIALWLSVDEKGVSAKSI
jgi:hypothetical protein